MDKLHYDELLKVYSYPFDYMIKILGARYTLSPDVWDGIQNEKTFEYSINYFNELFNANVKIDGANESFRDRFVMAKLLTVSILYCIKVNGSNIYCLSPNMYDALSSTVCIEDLNDIKFPYRSFYIQLPKKTLGLNSYGLAFSSNAHTDCHFVTGFSVYYDKKLNKIIADMDVDTGGNYSDVQIFADIKKYKTEEEMFREVMRTNKDSAVIDKRIIRILFNTIAYITSERCDLIPVTKIKTGKKSKEVEGKPVNGRSVVLVGSRFQPTKPIMVGTGTKVTKRHSVQAHFKRQRYGTGNSLVKVIWREEFFRGPEMADFIEKKYKIEEVV